VLRIQLIFGPGRVTPQLLYVSQVHHLRGRVFVRSDCTLKEQHHSAIPHFRDVSWLSEVEVFVCNVTVRGTPHDVVCPWMLVVWHVLEGLSAQQHLMWVWAVNITLEAHGAVSHESI
jgi:hypothetical protein